MLTIQPTHNPDQIGYPTSYLKKSAVLATVEVRGASPRASGYYLNFHDGVTASRWTPEKRTANNLHTNAEGHPKIAETGGVDHREDNH